MSDESELAGKISGETPWWAHAKDVPVWLAAGIVGVPSLIALLAGWFIAHDVSHGQKVLEQYSLSELHQLAGINDEADHRWSVILRFVDDTLRAEWVACTNAARDNLQRSRCITVERREQNLGLKPGEVPDPPD